MAKVVAVRVRVKAHRVRARRNNRMAAGHRLSRRMVMAAAVVVTLAMVATVRARRNLLRRKPVAMAVRRANPKARGRLALHCSAASRVAKALAAQVGAIRRVLGSADVELLCGWRRGWEVSLCLLRVTGGRVWRVDGSGAVIRPRGGSAD